MIYLAMLKNQVFSILRIIKTLNHTQILNEINIKHNLGTA